MSKTITLFLNSIKLLFSKGQLEDYEIIDDDLNYSTFMIFFSYIVSNLNISQYEDPSVNFENINNLLEEIR